MWYIKFNRVLVVYGSLMSMYNFLDRDYSWGVGYIIYASFMNWTANQTYRSKVRSARSEHSFQVSIQILDKVLDRMKGQVP